MPDLLALIGRDVPLRRTGSTHGGEYASPCYICRRGKGRPCGRDHFVAWPNAANGPGKPPGRWACLGPKAGRNGCDLSGDAIQYLRERDGLTYREACDRLCITPKRNFQEASGANTLSPSVTSAGRFLEVERPHPEPLLPPADIWQAHANGHAARCAALLWSQEGARARSYLYQRGLFDGVLRAHNVGYNPQDVWEDHARWGLPKPEHGARYVWIPRGITFPWYVDGKLWRLNVRRPLTSSQIAAGEAKYIGPAGFANALYNARSVRSGRPVVLVEGEIDALTIVQACGEQVAVVATGSTAGGRRSPWVARLALAPVVLVAFDADKCGADGSPGAGDRAAAWWLAVLPKARRWRPLLHDVNSLPDPEDVRGWVTRGLARALQ